jgi:type II secretory pathway pseudopilin PulG
MHARESGFSLLEVIIAGSLLLVMVFAVSTLSISGTDAQEYARRLNRCTEVTQDVLDGMRLDLISSARIFSDDAEGNSNLAVFDLSAAPPVLPGSRLPTIRSAATFQKDTAGDEMTGNRLLFARYAWADRFVCSSGREYLIDVYRWHEYHLTPEDGGPQPGRAWGLNLVRVLSEPLVDGSEIDRVTVVADQRELLLHFVQQTPDADGVVHPKTEVVWIRGAAAAAPGTFREIDPSNGILSVAPLLPRPPVWAVLPQSQEITGMLAYRHHSVASNHARASTGIGRYGLTDNTGAGFPHGFEVQVTGPSSARQILLHLVLVTTMRHGQSAWSDQQLVVDGRDI